MDTFESVKPPNWDLWKSPWGPRQADFQSFRMRFIPFKDKTNGKESYEGGRYIDAEILPGYKMVLDFNMAYHPSCAYNDKFICVLPPRENMLDLEIRADEKKFR